MHRALDAHICCQIDLHATSNAFERRHHGDDASKLQVPLVTRGLHLINFSQRLGQFAGDAVCNLHLANVAIDVAIGAGRFSKLAKCGVAVEKHPAPLVQRHQACLILWLKGHITSIVYPQTFQ